MALAGRYVGFFGFLAALLCPVAGRADSETHQWTPGERTAARVRGEIEPRDPEPIAGGVYGRFDGDLTLGIGAGMEFSSEAPSAAARLTLHYFWMAGVYASFRESFGDAARETRGVSVGVDVRPAFLPRFARNMQQGPAWLDLSVDSISLGLGAFWSRVDSALGDRRGFEASLGFGVPLLLRAPGPWLEARGFLRWPDAVANGAETSLLLSLSWHALFDSPLRP